jgi:two-component system, sensor histidine kinase and response regulator
MNTEKLFKILVVDDNPKNIQVIGTILRETNYLVGYATDGRQALNLLQKTYDFDLVLLDIDMPVLDGFETCKAMRRDNKLCEVPVIFLTAFAEEDKIIAGFDSGAQDYITKPFNSKELLSRVKTHLQLKYNTDQVKFMNQILEQKVAERTIELSKANEKLTKALAQLEVLDTAKNEFIQIISHEIRTPLNGIMGSIAFIKKHNLPEKDTKFLNILDESVKRLEHFSFRTLDISMLRAEGNKVLDISDINLKMLIDKCSIHFKDQLDSKKLAFKTKHASENGLIIEGDAKYLQQIFEIVIGNAIKQSPEEELVIIETSEKDNIVTVRITDKGKGFPDIMLDQTFPLFSTGKEHVNLNIGIDLHFVKLAVDAHSGKIIIGNNKDKGAFVITEFKKKL